jgi:hypothetical protein
MVNPNPRSYTESVTDTRTYGQQQPPPMARPANQTSEASVSAISWTSIFGGALAILTIGLILMFLASSLGLSSMSPIVPPNNVPNENENISTTNGNALAIGGAIALIVIQWVSAGIGGYLTGRLRTKWVNIHNDEIFFRDTVHGFLAWSLATALTVAFLTSATAAIVGGTVRAGTAVASGAALGAGNMLMQNSSMTGAGIGAGGNTMSVTDPFGYYIDMLFRSPTPNAAMSNRDAAEESTRILMRGVTNNNLSEADRAYLAQIISARTGVGPAEATRRVDTTFAQLQDTKQKMLQAAEDVRSAGVKISLYTFLSLLIGAFIACACAALGGRHRDQYYA